VLVTQGILTLFVGCRYPIRTTIINYIDYRIDSVWAGPMYDIGNHNEQTGTTYMSSRTVLLVHVYLASQGSSKILFLLFSKRRSYCFSCSLKVHTNHFCWFLFKIHETGPKYLFLKCTYITISKGCGSKWAGLRT